MSRFTNLVFRRSVRILFVLACFTGAARAEDLPPGRDVRIFDGTAREICYRTSSHAGSKQLQELMKMVPGGENVTVFKMPYPWKREPGKMKRYPIHVRRMNNNFGPAFKIEGDDDASGIAAGVNVLQEAVDADRKLGLKAVFYHSGHYNENTGAEAIRYIFNSRLAYRAFEEQNADPRFRAIDCITLTKEHFPATVRSDGFHASAIANYIEGMQIVRAMCEHDQIKFPEEIEALVRAKIAKAVANAELVKVTFPDFSLPHDEELRVGDTITVRWTADRAKVPGAYVMLHAVFRDDYYVSDEIPVDSPGFGKFTWTVTRDLLDADYGGRGGATPPEKAKQFTITNKRVHQNAFCFRVVTSDLAKAGSIYGFSTRFRINMDEQPRQTPRHFDTAEHQE